MKFPTLLTLALAVAIAPVFSHAQTFTVNPVNCGFYNTATYYCPTMTVTDSAGVSHSVFYEPLYNGRLNLLGFGALDGLGLAAVESITTASIVTSQGVVYTQTTAFTGLRADGTIYDGSSVITYTIYSSRGGGGRGGGGSGTRWIVTGGTITVNQ